MVGASACVSPKLILGKKFKEFLHLACHGAGCRCRVEIRREVVHRFREAVFVVLVDAFEGELLPCERNRMDLVLFTARFGTLL